ncbi:hypothetical protein WKV44_01440 [Spirochaetia bacterium 38H-sp]|uniref:Chromosome segregation ATPase n=1 Tax=Rarispira pelagica TaxID=3141764 RepID=A0ABU9U958_9SPIR
MGSLLSKAKEIRKEAGFIIVEQNKLPGKNTLTSQEEKEIAEEIEHIVEKNKIHVDENTFKIHAQKKGSLLPFLINLFAVIAIVSSFFVFRYLSAREQERIASGSTELAAVEAKLIQEIQRQAQEKLKEKEAEISTIQQKLSELAKQQEELEASMQDKIKQKEEELKGQLELVLAEERKKLEAQGASEETIREQLAIIEQQKNQELASQIDEFKRQAEEEKKQLALTIDNLKKDYQSSLDKLIAERKALEEEAKQKEEKLRKEYEEKTQSLLAQQQATSEELQSARARLASLGEQQQRSQLVEDRIMGLYSDIKKSLEQKDYDTAQQKLVSLQDFLNSNEMISLDSLKERRQIDLFVTDTLEQMIELQKQQTSLDTASLVAQANLLARIRATVSSAQEAIRQGDAESATKLYTEAIKLIPQIKESHAYLVSLLENAQTRQSKAVLAALDEADTAYKNKETEKALDAYKKALSYLPVDKTRYERIAENLVAIGETKNRQIQDAAEKTTIVRQKELAQQLMTAAEKLMSQARYQEAIEQYAKALADYPDGIDTAKAISGIRNSITAYNKQTEKTVADYIAAQKKLQQELDTIKKELEESNKENSKLAERIKELQAVNAEADTYAQENTKIKEENSKLTEERKQLQEKIAAMEQDNKKLTDRISELEKQLANAKNKTAPALSQEEKDALQEQIDTLNKKLESYERLKDSYISYARKEDQLISQYGETGLSQAKVYLDSFLSSPEAKASFPGLFSRIKAYDKAFTEAGKRSAMIEAIDIMEALSYFDTQEKKLAFLKDQMEQAKNNEALYAFLESLTALIQ